MVARVFLSIILSISFISCVTAPVKVEKEKTVLPEASTRYLRYIVQRGDTFWKIAQMAYNDSQKWPRIFEANKDKVKDVKGLTPGEIIVIPVASNDKEMERNEVESERR